MPPSSSPGRGIGVLVDASKQDAIWRSSAPGLALSPTAPKSVADVGPQLTLPTRRGCYRGRG